MQVKLINTDEYNLKINTCMNVSVDVKSLHILVKREGDAKKQKQNLTLMIIFPQFLFKVIAQQKHG